MTPESTIDGRPEWLINYRCPMDGSRSYFHYRLHELPLSEAASIKYTENGVAKRLEGMSLVTFIHPESELFYYLSLKAKKLQETLSEAGLGDMFAFLPEDTWHITIEDLAITKDKELPEQLALENQLELEKQITHSINNVFTTLNKEKKLTSKFYVRDDFVVCAGTSIVALAEPLNEEDLKVIHNIRIVVNEEIKHLKLPYQDPFKFIGHITLAYFTKSLNTEQYDVFKKIMQKSDEEGHPLGQVSIDQIELRRFSSMEDWGEKSLSTFKLKP
jgi:hypothetical protein